MNASTQLPEWGTPMEPACALALEASFGSVARWREDFAAGVRAHPGGAGWLTLMFQPEVGTLVNRWAGAPTPEAAAGVPLLALDLRETANATNAADALAAFFASIDWAVVYLRYQAAVHAASAAFQADADDAAGALLLDVRRAGAFEKSAHMLPGAQWNDPAQVAQWAGKLPTDREVVVYCVYGHEVGRATALRLRAAGVKARFLSGGIDGWQTAGRPLADKTST